MNGTLHGSVVWLSSDAKAEPGMVASEDARWANERQVLSFSHRQTW
jgi:hypothetical protein